MLIRTLLWGHLMSNLVDGKLFKQGEFNVIWNNKERLIKWLD